MRPAEQGFLLLSSHLGDPERKVLTTAQLRTLAKRAKLLPLEDRDLQVQDLLHLGYDPMMAQRIWDLLEGETQLEWYLSRGKRRDCLPLTRISENYPKKLRTRMGLDAPGCLWAKGDVSLLQLPAVALVGSRELCEKNRRFAEEAGRQAALQGYVLVSGNARGADQAAQDACLRAGGRVISVVADELEKKPLVPNVLWLSLDGFDQPFSTIRALSRNHVIHALGDVTLVAQCSLGKGGTWDGTTKNLRNNWSPVFCYEDTTRAMAELIQMGAVPVKTEALCDFAVLQENESFWTKLCE